MSRDFDIKKTFKTDPANTYFNIQTLLYLSARSLTKFFYNTSVHPHQVILASLIIGIASSFLIVSDNKTVVITGAILLFYKNVLDKVDGSLARAKGLDSRRGRFYDSITDFIVTLTTFTAIASALYKQTGEPHIILVVFASMIFSMLHTSYFILYLNYFLKYTDRNSINRIKENITPEDKISPDKVALNLQRVHQVIYGWQDSMFYKLDKMLTDLLSKHTNDEKILNNWYVHKPFMTLISILPIGTHIVLICLAAIFSVFDIYLIVNLIFMNLLLILSVVYHYRSVKNKISKT